MTKTALVLGAGGFIGSHAVKRLKQENFWVRAVDLKLPEFAQSAADEFLIGDLRDPDFVRRVLRCYSAVQSHDPANNSDFFRDIQDKFMTTFDEIYQFAADMGGAGFVFTGDNDAQIMHNSVTINLNVLEEQRKLNIAKGLNKTRIFYSGSACMYPSTTNSTRANLTAARSPPTPQTPTPSTAGRSSSLNASISLTTATMASRSGSPATQHLRARGHVARRQGKGSRCDM